MVKIRRLIIVLLILPFIVCFLTNAYVASDCGDGGGSTFPGEYTDLPDSDCSSAVTGHEANTAITGPDTAIAPGGYQYSASGGTSPYTFSVSGSGATVSSTGITGIVTLSGAACGAYTVTVTDACGSTASVSARITNNGRWGTMQVNAPCLGMRSGGITCISGKFRYGDGINDHRSYSYCSDLGARCGETIPPNHFVMHHETEEWICP